MSAKPPVPQYGPAGLVHVRQGEGEPVVFVHGTCGDWRTFDGIRETIAARFEYIAYSRRGHFPNSTNSEGEPCRQEEHVRDLTRFVSELQIGPVHLVGNSQGAFIALQMACEHPELVRRVIAGEPGQVAPLPDRSEAGRLAAQRRTHMAAIQRMVDRGELEGAAERLFDLVAGKAGAFGRVPAERRQRWLDNAHTLKMRGRERVLVSPETLRSVRPPVLVVRGSDTLLYYRETAEALATLLPLGMPVTVIPKAGHMSYLDNPVTFAEAVTAFLEAR